MLVRELPLRCAASGHVGSEVQRFRRVGPGPGVESRINHTERSKLRDAGRSTTERDDS